jgi:hypothetical protein
VPPSRASASSALSLLMIPLNQISGDVSTASVVPLQGFLPLNDVGWQYVELGCTVGCRHQLQGRSSYPGELCLAHPSPPLVLFPLGGPSMESSSGARIAKRSGVGCNGHGAFGKYVARWWR